MDHPRPWSKMWGQQLLRTLWVEGTRTLKKPKMAYNPACIYLTLSQLSAWKFRWESRRCPCSCMGKWYLLLTMCATKMRSAICCNTPILLSENCWQQTRDDVEHDYMMIYDYMIMWLYDSYDSYDAYDSYDSYMYIYISMMNLHDDENDGPKVLNYYCILLLYHSNNVIFKHSVATHIV